MHNFVITKTDHNTIRSCSWCGISYQLDESPSTGRVNWKAIPIYGAPEGTQEIPECQHRDEELIGENEL